MLTKATFTVLSCLAAVTVGGVLYDPMTPMHPWLPRPPLDRIITTAPQAGTPPTPSPIATPDEQEVFVSALNVTTTAPNRLTARQSRASCDKDAYCYAVGAAYCVTYLAGLGQRECRVGVGTVRMCKRYNAGIWGLAIRGEAANSCVNVARAAGRILDLCTHSDNQVTGQNPLDSDGNFDVIISA
ncbi:hypothetical protein PG993_011545 [Apiospora rasikravindrae]|uniref:Uncharacterized protein n=1 Tax=Apiospora rasikravindrae TaxID=990691 RepID=A0ABR1SGA2_9PEZI